MHTYVKTRGVVVEAIREKSGVVVDSGLCLGKKLEE